MQSLFNHTTSILKKINHRPNKNLGQNFLIDENVVTKFLRLAEPTAADNVVEIGPGLAVLTKHLLEIAKHVHVVEYDKNLADFLIDSFIIKKNFSILLNDAVKLPAGNIGLSDEPYKIISSLPYSISSPWLDNLLKLQNLPTSISLIIQEETADRFCAECNTKSFCPISIFLQSAYSKTNFQKISNKSFYPVPKVESAMVFFKKNHNPYIFTQQQKSLIRMIFSHRRKQIGGLLKKINQPDLLSWIERNNIDPMSRPAQISINAWQNILL